MTPSDIESIAIHPAIGIARVGNAPDAWFLAPEVRGGVPVDPDDFRDAKGRIKRQVPRFRIYATLKSGEVREITQSDAKITWQVEVANLKAGWYKFFFPMDLSPSIVRWPDKRNADVTGADRQMLDILPSARTISGPDQQGAAYRFDDGTFYGKPVYLGELRTDAAGRLLFFGGRGASAPKETGAKPQTFANNDGWHDDTCDGPVRATVEFDDQTIEATPAHVVVTPPNFGPGLFGVVTMDDVVRDLYVREGWLPEPTTTSFTTDIWPIFDRLTGHQWVNDGIFLVAGQGTPLDARDPTVIARLADASDEGQAFRDAVFRLFRRTDPPEFKPDGLPPFYGDTYGDDVDAAREDLLLTEMQYRHLERWVAGDFASDWTCIPAVPDIVDLPTADQCTELDRAALHECLGGPFHPGIEMTWPLRLATMWERPYRLRSMPKGERVRQDYGPELTRDEALAPDGPHGPNGAGSLTRWMGVPWQTDEASCNSGMIYAPTLYLSSPSFWGARVPNQVLPLEAYQIATTPGLSDLQAQRHFSNRRLWLRDINQRGYLERIDAMVSQWWEIGMVTAKSPPDGSDLPDPCYVETGRSPDFTRNDPTLKLAQHIADLDVKEDAGATPRIALERAVDDTPDEAAPPTYPTYGRGEV